jgi:hypothetical protein
VIGEPRHTVNLHELRTEVLLLPSGEPNFERKVVVPEYAVRNMEYATNGCAEADKTMRAKTRMTVPCFMNKLRSVARSPLMATLAPATALRCSKRWRIKVN